MNVQINYPKLMVEVKRFGESKSYVHIGTVNLVSDQHLLMMHQHY